MTTFHYEAFDSAGKLLKGEVDAETENEARELLWQRGKTAFEIKRKSSGTLFRRDIRLSRTGGALDDLRLSSLARDLAVLLQADVPLDAALRIVANNSADLRNRDAAQEMLGQILKGSTLASVLAAMDGATHEDCVHILRAGELSGNLGAAFQDVAELLERRLEIRRRIRSAMTYPILLIGLAVVSLWIVIGLLLPAVTPIFSENGMPLPPIIAFLNLIRRYAYEIFAVLCVGIASLAILVGIAMRQPRYRVVLDRLWLKLPLIGVVSRLREAARFTRTLSTLLRAGVPLLQALDASTSLVSNRHMRALLELAMLRIREGASLATALSENAALPTLAQQMVAVGEETGRLHEVLQRTASIFERQDQQQTDRLIAAMTPAVTIGIAALIAGVIISIMSAILSINDLVLR